MIVVLRFESDCVGDMGKKETGEEGVVQDGSTTIKK
jgi:hypothetical protein